MKKVIFCCAVLSVSISLNAQKANINPVVIGETLPQREFSNVINYPQKTLRLSDFKGKFILIDMWSTWCRSCIAAMPELHALQEKFKDNLQIILVNWGQGDEIVKQFVDKRAKMQSLKITLPVVYGDSFFTDTIMGVKGISAVYWVDNEGKLTAHTTSIEVTEENVVKFIKGRGVKKIASPVNPYNEMKKDTTVLWSSGLYKGTPTGSRFVMLEPDKNGMSAIFSTRASMLDLYRFAYASLSVSGERLRITESRIGLTVMEPEDGVDRGMRLGHYDQTDSVYSYRLIAPLGTSLAEMQNIMRADLKKWFGYDAALERRKIKYLSLTCIDSTRFKYRYGEADATLSDISLKINKFSIPQILKVWDTFLPHKKYLPQFPIVDETGFNGLAGGIDIQDVEISNYQALDKALIPYGLRLTLVNKETVVLVVKRLDSF